MVAIKDRTASNMTICEGRTNSLGMGAATTTTLITHTLLQITKTGSIKRRQRYSRSC
jgi:hypothetical protein